MIFVSVGTQLGFDRLIMAMDLWAEKNDISIFAQIGNGLYKPKNFKYKKWLTPIEYDEIILKSTILVSHAGMGTIITATSSQKTTIMLPRLSRFGEHRNDHQNSTAEKFKDRVGLYFVETDKELYNYLDIRDSLLKPNNVNQVSLDLMKTLEDFINN